MATTWRKVPAPYPLSTAKRLQVWRRVTVLDYHRQPKERKEKSRPCLDQPDAPSPSPSLSPVQLSVSPMDIPSALSRAVASCTLVHSSATRQGAASGLQHLWLLCAHRSNTSTKRSDNANYDASSRPTCRLRA